ncbi:hypothetical protein ACROYT_G023349 [Oculina patagonica]
MKTTVSSTDNYAGCKEKDCKEVSAFGRFVVDGRIKTCFRSLTEHNPWLMVHLNDYYPIFLVRITTSAISLHNVKVYVGDNNKTTHASGNDLPLCAYYEGMIQRNRLVSFGCGKHMYGNVVKIMTRSSILNLCEVEVYADPYVNIALKQFSEPQSKRSHLANDGDLKTSFTGSYWYLELGANVNVSVVFILHERKTNLEGFDIVVVNLAAKRPTSSNVNEVSSYKGCDQKIGESFVATVFWKSGAWWSVDLKAICKVHLVRIITAPFTYILYDLVVKVNRAAGFNKGGIVARLDDPTKEIVQTMTLPTGTTARYVTLERKSHLLMLQEVEIYNGALIDVNECDNPRVNCPRNFRCQDHPNSFTCECDGGFKLTGPNKTKCIDIDECLSNPCHVNASCSNTHGSYKCTCHPGFAGDGRFVCSGKFTFL